MFLCFFVTTDEKDQRPFEDDEIICLSATTAPADNIASAVFNQVYRWKASAPEAHVVVVVVVCSGNARRLSAQPLISYCDMEYKIMLVC